MEIYCQCALVDYELDGINRRRMVSLQVFFLLKRKYGRSW